MDDQPLGLLLSRAVERWGERECLILGTERLSYAELSARVDSAAGWLAGVGLLPGERVLAQAGNGVELIVLELATWRAGGVAVPVVPIYRRHELTAIVADTRPAVIAAASSAGSRAPYAELLEVLTDVGHTPRAVTTLDEPLTGEGPLANPSADPLAAQECCAILFTSGTTSAPKGARISGRALLANLHNWGTAQALTADDVTLSGAPLAHIGGLQSLLIPMLCGGRAVILPHWDGDLAVAAIEAERATLMSGPPVFLADLVERYERGASRGHRLRRFLSGGAPTPLALIERAQAVGIEASRCYGMTETAGAITASPPGTALELRAGTDGRVLAGTEIEIVDDAGAPLPAGEVGQIRIRSVQLLIGYTDPDLTMDQFSDGWFVPGDLGQFSADGWLTMVGRSKDIINRGGEKFSAQDIEAALAGHPAIRDVAVMGLPDERLGEKVAAFVVLTPGEVWAGPQAVLVHLESVRLARPKFPVAWYVLDELPRTASGKVAKNLLPAHAAGLVGRRPGE